MKAQKELITAGDGLIKNVIKMKKENVILIVHIVLRRQIPVDFTTLTFNLNLIKTGNSCSGPITYTTRTIKSNISLYIGPVS